MSFRPGARQFFERRAAPAWTNPYVTDGLVAMWDGEWNSGGGVHDPNATVWKDLVGNNDGTLTQYAAVGADSVQITSTGGYAVSFRGDITAAYTIEMVAKMTAWNTAPRLTAESPYPSLYFSSYPSNESYPAFYGQGFDGIISVQAGVRDRTKRFSFAVSYSTGTLTGFFDGDVLGTRALSSAPSSVATATMGNRLSGGRGWDGEICACRVYSRAITAAEIAANYAIDKARFNLP